MVILNTRMSEDDEDKIVVTTLLIDFLDAHGQLTTKSVVESCRNSHSSKLL